MNKKSKGRTSKDFYLLWARLYQEKYHVKYHIKWVLDGAAFKRLMATYSNTVLTKMIKFVFNDDTKATTFLRSTGYNVVVFERSINQYYHIISKTDSTKLPPEIPYWDDVKFSFIVNCVDNDDVLSLPLIEYSEETDKTWLLLLRTVEEQNRKMSYKFKIFYKRWKRTTIKRSRIPQQN